MYESVDAIHAQTLVQMVFTRILYIIHFECKD